VQLEGSESDGERARTRLQLVDDSDDLDEDGRTFASTSSLNTSWKQKKNMITMFTSKRFRDFY
jgi:hypothetical protein